MSTLQKLPQAEQQMWAERVESLVAGKTKTSNPQAQHSIDKLREARAEFDVIRRNSQQLEVQLKNIRDRGLRLEGICEQCIDDLVHWESAGQTPVERAPGLPKGRNGKATAADVKAAS